MVDAPQRPALMADDDVDVCVIGGGLAGLTTACEIARAGWSVVLLEAGHIAGEASGRNTGFVLPGFAASPDSIISRVGFDRAKDLWALAQGGVDYVRNVIRDEAMPGIDPQDGWLYVSKTDNGDELTRLAGLVGEFGGEIEGWPTDQVRAVLRSERYFHAIHYPRAINIHPLNYALGLAAAAERVGARIFEHTPALSLDPAGVRKRIVTPHARLRANHVVLRGNLRIAGLMPQIGATLIPITTYVITTASLGPALGEAVGYRGSISDSDLADNHYRIVGGDRLMWSGRATMWAGNPRRYVRALAADIGKTYPQLGKVAVDYAWSGSLGHTIHRMPQIGELGPGRMARQRLRRPRAQHHGDGRQPHCSRHRRWRSHLEAVYAIRTCLGRRQVRPHGRANLLLDATLSRRAGGTSRQRRRESRARHAGKADWTGRMSDERRPAQQSRRDGRRRCERWLRRLRTIEPPAAEIAGALDVDLGSASSPSHAGPPPMIADGSRRRHRGKSEDADA